MSAKRDIINVASTTLPAPTSSAMPVTTAEGTEVATVVVPVSALAPEVDLEWKQLHRHADGTLSWRPSGPPPGWRRSRT